MQQQRASSAVESMLLEFAAQLSAAAPESAVSSLKAVMEAQANATILAAQAAATPAGQRRTLSSTCSGDPELSRSEPSLRRGEQSLRRRGDRPYTEAELTA